MEIEERGKPTRSTIHTSLPFDAPCDTADALRAAFVALCTEAKLPAISAEMLSLPGSSDGWSLPEDMWLNATPNSRSVRRMFYADVSEALQAALAHPAVPRRMRITCTPPELNMEMNSYRIGTLLELVRTVAIDLYNEGLNVRVCVQGSMGEGAFTGLPRVTRLTGARTCVDATLAVLSHSHAAHPSRANRLRSVAEAVSELCPS